jgi:hypothetical protein
MEVAFDNVYTLIHEKKISSKNNLLPLLEQITKSSCLTANTILLAPPGVQRGPIPQWTTVAVMPPL